MRHTWRFLRNVCLFEDHSSLNRSEVRQFLKISFSWVSRAIEQRWQFHRGCREKLLKTWNKEEQSEMYSGWIIREHGSYTWLLGPFEGYVTNISSWLPINKNYLHVLLQMSSALWEKSRKTIIDCTDIKEGKIHAPRHHATASPVVRRQIELTQLSSSLSLSLHCVCVPVCGTVVYTVWFTHCSKYLISHSRNQTNATHTLFELFVSTFEP